MTSEYICIAMEYATGGSLFHYVQKQGKLKVCVMTLLVLIMECAFLWRISNGGSLMELKDMCEVDAKRPLI